MPDPETYGANPQDGLQSAAGQSGEGEEGEAPERLSPRYRGLYASGRPACQGVRSFGQAHHGVASDISTLYPEELSSSLARRAALLDGIKELREKGRRLGSRDLTRLGGMERELAAIERRLTMHGKRARGAHLAAAQALGKGWPEYLLGLCKLLFFLEKSQENIGSLAKVLKDPGSSPRAIVKVMEDSLRAELEDTRNLADTIDPPESLSGEPMAECAPKLTPPPEKRGLKRLTAAAGQDLAALEAARLAALDALLLAEKKTAELCALKTAAPAGASPAQPQSGPQAAVLPKAAVLPEAPEAAAGLSFQEAANGPSLPKAEDPGANGPPLAAEAGGGFEPASAEGANGPALAEAAGEFEPAAAAEAAGPAFLAEATGFEAAGAAKDSPREGSPEAAKDTPGKGSPEAAKASPGAADPIPLAPKPGSAPAPLSPEGKVREAPPPVRRSPLRVLTALTAGLALALLVVWVKSHFFAPPEDADFYIYNGLGQTVTVGFPGGGAVLAPGDRHTQRLRLGEKFEITTRINGHDAEKLSVQAPQSPETSLIYSAAGAVPFVEWVARYGPESGSGTGERALGAPTLFYTDARAVLTMPPETVRSKSGSESILTLTPVRMHPELMLRDLPKGERDQIVEAQARWNDPSEQYLPLWLNYLTLTAQERALEILEDRLADYPGDVFAIRALMDSCPRERRAELCEGVAADAESRPSDPSLAYLSVRCLEPKEARGEKYLALAEKFPGDAFASRAAGFALFFRGDFEGAHALLKRAFHQEPRVMLADMDFLARLMRHQGENTAVISSEIGPWSPHIRQLLSIGEAGGGEFSESTGEAFRLLAEGRPAEACGAAAPPLSQYMLYLCAASDGAPRELVERALDAPPLEHLATGNAWPAMGLFLREKRDPAAIEGYILDNASDLTEAVSAIHLAKEMDPEQLDHFMLGLDPWLQGSLSLVLRIALGEECPERFSEAAKGFLFAAERPYLR